jgi:hypothetical protein
MPIWLNWANALSANIESSGFKGYFQSVAWNAAASRFPDTNNLATAPRVVVGGYGADFKGVMTLEWPSTSVAPIASGRTSVDRPANVIDPFASSGPTAITKYRNRVWDTVASKFVHWSSEESPDEGGSHYPGPGTYGVDTPCYSIVGKQVVET